MPIYCAPIRDLHEPHDILMIIQIVNNKGLRAHKINSLDQELLETFGRTILSKLFNLWKSLKKNKNNIQYIISITNIINSTIIIVHKQQLLVFSSKPFSLDSFYFKSLFRPSTLSSNFCNKLLSSFNCIPMFLLAFPILSTLSIKLSICSSYPNHNNTYKQPHYF